MVIYTTITVLVINRIAVHVEEPVQKRGKSSASSEANQSVAPSPRTADGIYIRSLDMTPRGSNHSQIRNIYQGGPWMVLSVVRTPPMDIV